MQFSFAVRVASLIPSKPAQAFWLPHFSTIRPFSLPAENMISGIPSSLVVDLPVMLLAMLMLTVPTLIRGKVSRVQGILMLAVYFGFCIFSFTL